MSYIIGKYLLWMLLCIPVFIGLYLMMDDLLDDVLKRHSRSVRRRNLREKNLQRRREFEINYSETHSGKYE